MDDTIAQLVNNGVAIALVLGGAIFAWRSVWPWFVDRDRTGVQTRADRDAQLLIALGATAAALERFSVAMERLMVVLDRCTDDPTPTSGG
jgi:hypothetical protein